MNISQAVSLTSPRKKRRRIGRGRGSGMGKTSTRGMDGAASRSGWSERNRTGGAMPLWRRLPKVGFSNCPFKKGYSPINVGALAIFPAETYVTPELLKERGLVKQVSPDGIKVLATGSIDRPLKVRAHAFSKAAKEKIEAAGGTVERIPEPKKPVRNKMRPRAPKEQEDIKL